MTERFAHPDTPFPIGVEYYRGGAPKRECWDEAFANIGAAGFRIVRSASYWNWMEPARDTYHLDDYDAMFDLAAKHGLSMWLGRDAGNARRRAGVDDTRLSRLSSCELPRPYLSF